ncbi:MAG TPA: BolA family transcriptional regulator [Solirubrobacteraceae bacterium]|nr:BolA family transcriptional regulator [Solirubrobacteraceae bacterium]
MQAGEIKERIEAALPQAQVEVEDFTGGGDHFRARVISPAFAGKSRIERHRLIYAIFGAEIGGPIHALSLQTLAPGELPSERQQPAGAGGAGASR